MEVGGRGRRRRSLSDEEIDSPNHNENSHSASIQTLASALSQKRQPEAANRTLLDVIRDDPSSTHHRKTWRTFKDKIRLRRAGSAWTSSVHVPASDVPLPSSNRMMSRRQSTRFPTTGVADDQEDQSPEINQPGIDSMPSSRGMMMRHNSSRLPNLATTSYGRGVEFSTSLNTSKDKVRVYDEDEDEGEEEEEEGEEGESDDESPEPQVRMSLMALLAETDKEMGLDGSPFMMGDEDDDEDEEEDEVRSAGEYNTCCVCMVRHKGAVFVPCGHTFCRLCSKELWVQKGNCPLCNNFILEILDIF